MDEALIAFLRARLDEDEKYARSIAGMYEDAGVTDDGSCDGVGREKRMLRDVDARQSIVGIHTPVDGFCPTCRRPNGRPGTPSVAPCSTLRLIAHTYRDHPDYRADWRV